MTHYVVVFARPFAQVWGTVVRADRHESDGETHRLYEGEKVVYKKTKTKSSGKFRTSIGQAGNKKTCFKVQVPATPVYKKTTSRVIGCIESG